MKLMRGIVVALVGAAMLVGCGGGSKIGSKEDAAKALATISGAASKGNSASASQGLNGVTSTGSATVKGDKSGTATVDFSTDTSDTSLGLKFTMTFADYSDDGKTNLTGPLTFTFKMDGDFGGAGVTDPSNMALKMNIGMDGKITMTGETSDTVEMAITELFEVVGSTSTVTINGTVKTSAESYTFNNEKYTFTEDQT